MKIISNSKLDSNEKLQHLRQYNLFVEPNNTEIIYKTFKQLNDEKSEKQKKRQSKKWQLMIFMSYQIPQNNVIKW